MNIKKRKIWIFPLPIFIAILIVLFGGGAIIYALTKTTEKAGPVGYWKLDEGSGYTAYDASGNSNTGTLTNFDFDDDSNWETGKVAGALEFDGVNDYVDCGTNDILDITQAITLEAWVKTSVSQSKSIVSKSYDYNIEIWGGNASAHLIFVTGGDLRFSTSFAINTGNWVHEVITWDTNNGYVRIYINGVLIYTSPSSYAGDSLRNTTGILAIGRASDTDLFNGLIDEVRIYNRALSAAEVSWNYNRGGPVGWWKFDEGSGSYAYDSSGNTNTGTWSGTGTTHWAEGKINGAGQFNGSDDKVDAGNILSLSYPFTIETWINSSDVNKYYAMIVGKYQDSPYYGYVLRFQSTTGKIDFAINQAAGSAVISSPTALTNNVWYHIVGVYDGSYLYLYINGLSVATPVAYNKALIAWGSTFKIGVVDQAIYYQGKIDDVRIYNYARSAVEVKMDYNFGYAAKFGGSYDLSRGLVGYWKFEEGPGYQAKDSTLNANNGTLTNFDFDDDSNWTTGNTAAGTGGALSFDGSDDYVSVADSSTLDFGTNDFTLSTWFKSDTSGIYHALVSKYDSGSPFSGYAIMVRNTNVVSFYINGSGAADTTLTGTTNVADGNWHHIAAFRSGASTMKIYIDGKLDASRADANAAALSTSATALNMGRDNTGDDKQTDGKIDDVRIYNRALSADEIRYLYNRKGPVGWWKFDEGSGTSVKDSSFNANTGTWSGTGTHWTTGKINGAGQFASATSDYVGCGTGTSLRMGTNDYTVEAWVKSTSTEYQFIAGIMQANVSTYELHIRDGNVIRWRTDDSTQSPTFYEVSATFAYNDGNWHHIVGTRVGAVGTIYIDGLPRNNGTLHATNVTANTALAFRIGQRSDGGWIFDGLIDDVRIYNYARTAAEIKADYNSGFAVKFGGSYDLNYGLVGHWKFEEGSGYTAYDSTLNANNGTLTNFDFDDDSNWTTGNTAAGTGGALEFDNVDDYVVPVSNPSLSNFTWSAWIKSNNVVNENPVISYSVNHMLENRDSKIYYWCSSACSGGAISGVTTLSNDQWYHFVATYDGTTVTLYLNGQYENSKAVTSGVSGSFRIGRDYLNNYWDGLIDDVRVYNRALSADEIRYLYNRRQPIGHWKFDEGAGTSAYDSSINGNTGTFGAGAAAPAWAEGKIGRALSFDGGDYVDAGNEINVFSSNFTFEAWFKTSAADDYYTIVRKGNSNINNQNYKVAGLRVRSNNKLSFFLSDGDGVNEYEPISINVVNDGAWHHGVATVDLTNKLLSLYVDGLLQGSPTSITGFDGFTITNKLFIGVNADGDTVPGASPYYFNGFIDDVRVYNYARTAAEVKADYNAGMSTYFK